MKKMYTRFLMFFMGLLLLSSASQAQVVISQVYGGGGNTGATLKNDFIELFNRGTATVDLTGWSVQYASSAGTSWQRTNLAGTIAPGQYYLVRQAQGAGGTVDLPTPDAIGTIGMSGTAGKVALVNSVATLTGGCPAVIDFVGFGSATNCSETSPTPTLSNTTAALRKLNGCTDTDNNSTDFVTGAAAPRNSSSAFNTCVSGLQITTASPLADGTINAPYSVSILTTGGTAPLAYSISAGALPTGLSLDPSTGVLAGTPTATGTFNFDVTVNDAAPSSATKSFSLTINPAPCNPPTHTIAQIQGSGIISPINGSTVTVRGIVTSVRSNGFFIQSRAADADADPNTSEGVFVFTNSAPTAAATVGNGVCVSGTVIEYIPSTDPGSPAMTEITSPTVIVLSTGNALPEPVMITAALTNPAGDYYQLEKYESMRVAIESVTVSSPTGGTKSEANATSTSNGAFYGVITGIARPFREEGYELPGALPAGAPATVTRYDANPEVLSFFSRNLLTGSINVAAGDMVSNIIGVLDFSARTYTINLDPASTPTVTINNPGFTAVPQQTEAEMTVASFNMERFYDNVNDPDGDALLNTTAYNNRLQKVSLGIRNVLKSPDIIAAVEVEKLSVLQAIADKVNNDAVANGDANPNYTAYLVEGNDVGGIDVGFLVKQNRVSVTSVTQEGKNTMFQNPDMTTALLNDRPPLVLKGSFATPGCATVNNFTVIVNHLRSLNSVDDPIDGPRVRAKRLAQAEFLANLIQAMQVADPTANIISVGDYNAFEFSDGLVDIMGTVLGTPVPASEVVLASPTITNPALINLTETLPANIRYSYVFDGSAQVLDHVVVNQNMLPHLSRYEVARLNADFPEVWRSDATRPERISDHDAAVAYFLFKDQVAPIAVCKAVTVTLANGAAIISATDVDGGSSDNCGITEMLVSKTSFDCSNIGENEVTLTVTDAGGLSSTCTAIVTVIGEIPSATISAVPETNIYTGGIATNIYLGYGSQSVTLDANATGGTAFTYAWTGNGTLSCTDCEAPVFAPTAPGVYTFEVTVTNQYGCSATSAITICVADIRVPGTDGKKVYVCNTPNGNANSTKTLAISVNAVAAHMAKPNSKLGDCSLNICGAASIIAGRNLQFSKEADAIKGLEVKVLPNPSTTHFTLQVRSNSTQAVTLRITDLSGRSISQLQGISPNTSVQVGTSLLPGVYIAELLQGGERKTVKLMKVQ